MTEHAYDRAGLERLVPDHIFGGLDRYVTSGIPTGDGCRRILEDQKCSEVISGLDRLCQANLADIYRGLYNCIPMLAWGSEQKVAAWIKHRGLAGID